MAAVLLVDDDDVARNVVRKMIERGGHHVEEAGDGAAGVDLQDELLKSDMDRAAREAAAARQLEELKKKMRKD